MEIAMDLKTSMSSSQICINFTSSALPAQFHQEATLSCQAACPGLSLMPCAATPRTKADACLLPSAGPAAGAPRLSRTEEPRRAHRLAPRRPSPCPALSCRLSAPRSAGRRRPGRGPSGRAGGAASPARPRPLPACPHTASGTRPSVRGRIAASSFCVSHRSFSSFSPLTIPEPFALGTIPPRPNPAASM